MRENASLTRPTYIEADLRRIFEADGFADFAALWLLVHASRFGAPGAPITDCALERWREAAGKEGIAARDRLRKGVEDALLVLGQGFLTETPELRERVVKGELPLIDYFGQLLRLIYRLIFLAVAEERDLLFAPNAPATARRLYADGYSFAALRAQAIRRSAWDRHFDKWQGLQVVFLALARGEKRLGLPALGGLFLPETDTRSRRGAPAQSRVDGGDLQTRLAEGRRGADPHQLARHGDRGTRIGLRGAARADAARRR